tara:strand:- start:2149 stop:2670 length:522 start_codon:yes stop_codon:yes gene_type:complete
MFTRLIKIAIGIIIIPFLFLPAHSYYLVEGLDEFIVIPNKTYTGDICIGEPTTNSSYNFFVSELNTNIFSEFYFDKDSIFVNEKTDILCNNYHFKTLEYKHEKTDSIIQRVYVEESDANKNFIYRNYAHNIKLDASSITYQNALYQLSWKFILVFVSIYALFTTLLYIIKNYI